MNEENYYFPFLKLCLKKQQRSEHVYFLFHVKEDFEGN